MKEKIAITTDSGVIKHSRKALVIPSCINDSDNNNYLDQYEINNSEIYARRKLGEKFKTSSPVMGDVIKTFEKQLEENDKIIHLSMSSGISEGSYNVANIAANIVDSKNIAVVDTKQGGIGGALVVEIVDKLIQEGFSSKEIVELLNKKILSKINTTFLVPNPVGFLQSGRNKTNGKINQLWKETLVKMLSNRGVQFEVVCNNGSLEQKKKHIYNTKNMYVQFIADTLQDINNIDANLVVYGGTMPKEERMDSVKKYLEDEDYFKNIVRSDMSGVISSYACENTFGISYIKTKRSI